jgi:hypothetical protein
MDRPKPISIELGNSPTSNRSANLLKPKRSVLVGAWFNSPASKGHNEVRPRFFPTVAWPSEAVRGCDDSITFIQKRADSTIAIPST